MVKKTITINNPTGLHARPATLIVKEASKYKSHISLAHGTHEINAKSIMGIMSMGLSMGSEVDIIAEGVDEHEALEGIVVLFESNFGE
ncbi:MAG: HPr family phosphocarrier protein [Alkaliphilus sp.]|nr:HPr family phosphocarrier protein [Alkaliphilus sp.]